MHEQRLRRWKEEMQENHLGSAVLEMTSKVSCSDLGHFKEMCKLSGLDRMHA